MGLDRLLVFVRLLALKLLLHTDISFKVCSCAHSCCFDQRPQTDVRALNIEDQRRWFPCQHGLGLAALTPGETVMYVTLTWVRVCVRECVYVCDAVGGWWWYLGRSKKCRLGKWMFEGYGLYELQINGANDVIIRPKQQRDVCRAGTEGYFFYYW